MIARIAIVSLAIVVLLVPGLYADEPSVAWELNLSDSSILGQLKERIPQNLDMDVRDGILRITGDLKSGQPWENLGSIAFTFTFPEPFDLTEHPVLEVQWRSNRPTPGNLLIQPRIEPEAKDGITLGAYYYTGTGGKDQWVTHASRLFPDVGFPSERSATRLKHVTIRGYPSGQDLGVYTFEIKSIKLRALNKKEREELEVRAAPLRAHQAPPVPERFRNTFLYATCHIAPYVGGWEGFFDELARAHINGMEGPGQWYADMVHVARAAESAGIMLFPWVWASPGQYEGTWQTAGPDQARMSAARQVKAAEGLSAIAGWFIADEPSLDHYLGVAGIKDIYDKLDPDRVAIHVHFNPDRIKYFDRFSTIINSDCYPLQKGKRDPWAIAEWCREIDGFSSKPHWLWPQAFGNPDPDAKEGYHLPTAEEFRLMMYLALANGVKGFVLFDYYHPQWMALADKVGNLTPIGTEAAAIGRELLAVGPLLLQARGIYDPTIAVESTGNAAHGVSIGAMGNPQTGPLFLVAVNEDLKVEQGGRAHLPKLFAQPGRALYDLYALTQIAPAGSNAFHVAPLPPGDGRIYMLATGQQFAAAEKQLVTNRVNEMLRIQRADREIAKNWGAYDAVEQHHKDTEEVRRLLDARSYSSAEEKAIAAGKTLQDAMSKISYPVELRDVSEALAGAKKALGELDRTIHRGYHARSQQPREGMEHKVEPFEALCHRYSRVRHDYLKGRYGGPWTDFREGAKEIRSAAQTLLTDVRTFAEELSSSTSR